MRAKKEKEKINWEIVENERNKGGRGGGSVEKKTEEEKRIKKKGIVEERMTEDQSQTCSFLWHPKYNFL